MCVSKEHLYMLCPSGQRVLSGSAPVNIPGSLARSSSFNSSSSLSTSPLSSLSQSLSQSLLSGTVSQQNQPSNMLAKQEHGLLGTPTSSSQNSLGKLIAFSPEQAGKHLLSSASSFNFPSVFNLVLCAVVKLKV